jgi:hypothetical protein
MMPNGLPPGRSSSSRHRSGRLENTIRIRFLIIWAAMRPYSKLPNGSS